MARVAASEKPFTFPPLVRALLLVTHEQSVVENLEALVTHEKSLAWNEGYEEAAPEYVRTAFRGNPYERKVAEADA